MQLKLDPRLAVDLNHCKCYSYKAILTIKIAYISRRRERGMKVVVLA
jgi:hypothetical protein